MLSSRLLSQIISIISKRNYYVTFVMATQTFAIRFSTIEIAQEFKTAFLKGQEEMARLLSGSDSASAKDGVAHSGPQEALTEVKELTDAVEALNVVGVR